MCFDFLSTFPNLPVSLRNTYLLRNKINQICAWASQASPACSPGIPHCRNQLIPAASPGRQVLDPKDETQELSGQAASEWWPPKAAHLTPAKRGVFRPAQGQAEGLDRAILG